MVVDEDPMILHHLQLRLKILEYEVCAIARTGDEAVKLYQETNPDIVLMNIRMPRKTDGSAAAREIKANPDSQLFFFRDSAIRNQSLAQIDSLRTDIYSNPLLIGLPHST